MLRCFKHDEADSWGEQMSAQQPEPTEEELRAAYEAEIKKIRVEHLLLETIVSLVNLGMRRSGIAPGTEAERDPEQVKLSIEAIRALLPLVEQAAPQQAAPIREALSQLQLAFVRSGGQGQPASAAPPGQAQTPASGPGAPPPPPGAPGEPPPPPGAPGEPPPASPDPESPGEAGPAQRSGRLWIPGQ
jgi:hypothetical protein